MGWYSYVKAIQDALKEKLTDLSSFGGRVYLDYWTSIKEFPALRLIFQRDDTSPSTGSLDVHYLTFQVEVLYRGRATEEDKNKLMEYTGEVVDALLSDRELACACENLEVTRVDLGHRVSESMILHYALITIVVRKLW